MQEESKGAGRRGQAEQAGVGAPGTGRGLRLLQTRAFHAAAVANKYNAWPHGKVPGNPCWVTEKKCSSNREKEAKSANSALQAADSATDGGPTSIRGAQGRGFWSNQGFS